MLRLNEWQEWAANDLFDNSSDDCCSNCTYLELIPSNIYIKPFPYCNFQDMDLVEGPNEVNPDYHVCENFTRGEKDEN